MISKSVRRRLAIQQGRDIFKDDASPELEAVMAERERIEAQFWSATPARRRALLELHSWLLEVVMCEECRQILPGPESDAVDIRGTMVELPEGMR
jgi:hypothetical protein